MNPAHEEAGPRDASAGAADRPTEAGEAVVGGKRVWLNLDDVSDEKLLSFFGDRAVDLPSLEDVTPPEHRSTDAEDRDTEPDTAQDTDGVHGPGDRPNDPIDNDPVDAAGAKTPGPSPDSPDALPSRDGSTPDEVEQIKQVESDWRELTDTDVDAVERHLARLDHSPANDAMTSRIRDAMADGRPLTEGERNFIAHELTEAGLMDDGMPYEDAHELASQTHPLMRNYDPEVIEQFPELFNNNWRRTWGLDPR